MKPTIKTTTKAATEKLSPDHLKDLCHSIFTDKSKLDTLSFEELAQLRQYVDPLGAVDLAHEKSYINVSITNWRDRYMRKFITTAMIGYIYKVAEEYDPGRVIGQLRQLYPDLPEGDLDKMKKGMRANIRSFLDSVFTYDPNHHIGQSTKSKVDDPIRARYDIVLAMRRQLNTDTPTINDNIVNESNDHQSIIKQCNEDIHALNAYLHQVQEELAAIIIISPTIDSDLLKVYQSLLSWQLERQSQLNESYPLTNAGECIAHASRLQDRVGQWYNKAGLLIDAIILTYEKTISTLASRSAKELVESEFECLLARSLINILDTRDSFTRTNQPGHWYQTAINNTIHAATNPPSQDLYHHFDRYITNNYEPLREICSQLYCEKPDIDYSITYYDHFETPEEAKEHRIKNADRFKNEVLTIENNGVTFIGPFKKNRERVDFYNKDMEILKEMMDQVQSDHALGKNLMEKRVKEKKIQNIKEVGFDHPGLSEYSKVCNQFGERGVQKGLTKKEIEGLKAQMEAEKGQPVYVEPEDSVQVDVFYPEDGTLRKTHFFTQAEAPLHLIENSEYKDKYQPIRGGNPT